MIEPVNPIVKERLTDSEIHDYTRIGIELIKNRKLAVCTLAGGQGTRLGHNGPKGTFIVNFDKIASKSIFEIHADNILRIYNNYQVFPFWYIMTSKDNDIETKEFFEKNDYFGIPSENILFFIQGEFPLTRANGEVVLDKNGHEVTAANGNGGIFKALEDEGIIAHMEKNDIDYICSCNVDNILVNPFDEVSIGAVAKNNAEIGIKSVSKANKDEKVGSIVIKDDKTTVIEYIDMPKELTEALNSDGDLKFSDSHFGCNYIKIDLLKRIANQKLPIHEAHKKNDVYGEFIKREMFIFDGFEMANKALVIRVKREEEFAPIKNKEGVDSPETASKMYEKMFSK